MQSTDTSPANRTSVSLEATDMEALQRRIAALEEELAQTKVQLAQAKSSEEKTKIELARMTDALTNATGKDDAMDTSVPEGTAKGDEAAGSGNEMDQMPTTVSVTTADPFLRQRQEPVVLNPSSCASGINLLHDLQTSLSNALSSNGSFASLLGRRRRGSRNNARVDSHVQRHERSGSQNAEWDTFENKS